jgi:hypothetical protein
LLGRLSVVEEARQKARIVGITDWWTQVLFKPLHDKIAEILKSLPEDGTFNQIEPVKNMLLLHRSSSPVISSDLSNATDRLPVSLQRDILIALGVLGKIWENILDRPYFINRPHPMMVKYSVGQPMGVYSSFVMLSLTNHIINVIACEMSGLNYKPGTHLYSVLGDDQASRDSAQASNYVKILTYLGVSVNPIKGFNGFVCEFAKRIFFLDLGLLKTNSSKVTEKVLVKTYYKLSDVCSHHPAGICNNCIRVPEHFEEKVVNSDISSFVEISPIGAKVILQAMNNPMFAVSAIQDMKNKQYSLLNAVSILSNYLTTLFPRGITPTEMYVCNLIHLLALLGPQSGL